MTDIRQVNRALRQRVEGMAVQWMNATFPTAFTILDKKERRIKAKELKKERMRAWAASTSSSSPPLITAIDLTDPAANHLGASFTVTDAVWVNRQLHWWAQTAWCNRGVKLSLHQRHLLRVPMADIPSQFHVRSARYAELNRGRPVEEVVEGRRLSCSYWLVDVLTWVLEEFGHAESFLRLHDTKAAHALRNQQRMQTEKAKNKDPERLREAMEREGVRWSEWKWDAVRRQWNAIGCTVWWNPLGYGRWQMSTLWQHNQLHHPELYEQSKRAHIALRKLGFWCNDCDFHPIYGGSQCHAKTMGWLVKEKKTAEGQGKGFGNTKAAEEKEDVVLLEEDEVVVPPSAPPTAPSPLPHPHLDIARVACSAHDGGLQMSATPSHTGAATYSLLLSPPHPPPPAAVDGEERKRRVSPTYSASSYDDWAVGDAEQSKTDVTQAVPPTSFRDRSGHHI